MKVLHFAPSLQSGGATQLAVDLAYALQTLDVQSILAAPAEDVKNTPAATHLRYIPYRPYTLPGKWGELLKLRNLIADRKPDILQAYGYAAIATAAKACRLLSPARRPLLIGAITGYPSSSEALQAAELPSCAAITVISKHLRQRLKQQEPSITKSWVIPYGVNETLCYPLYQSSQEWNNQWATDRPELRNRFTVCLPGPISSAHGTADIVPIISTLLQQDIPVHILIAGDSNLADPAFMATLRRRIRSSGVEQHITWLENTSPLRDILCSSHAVINLATSPEAYNRPMLEALSLGRPVAGYDHGIAGEYLEAFLPVGIAPVGDYDAIADLLSQWHTNPPDPVEHIPYPYRLSDTAKSYYDLYNTLTQE